jgi:hypothetical protein
MVAGSPESAGGFDIFNVFEQVGQEYGYFGHALTSHGKLAASKKILKEFLAIIVPTVGYTGLGHSIILSFL